MTEEVTELPGKAEEHLDKAFLYEAEDDFTNVLAESEAALSLDPNLAEAHNLRAIALEEMGRQQEAHESYREAVRLAPGSREFRRNLAEFEAELPGHRRARRSWLLQNLGQALHVLAWAFPAVQILLVGVNVYVWADQGIPHDARYVVLVTIQVLQNLLVGAIAFVALHALGLMARELSERIAKEEKRAT